MLALARTARLAASALPLLARRRAASSLAPRAAALAPAAPADADADADAGFAGQRPRALAPSTLYVVAVPIGNLRDVTLRALDVLSDADAILCEDSRRTRRLLTAHGLRAIREGGYADAPWDNDALAASAADEADCVASFAASGLAPEAEADGVAAFAASGPAPEAGPPGPPAVEAPLLPAGGPRAAAEAVARLRLGQSLALVADAGTPCLSDPGARLVAAVVSAGFAVRAVPGASAVLAALCVSGWDVHAHYTGGRSAAAERADEARSRRRALAAGFGPGLAVPSSSAAGHLSDFPSTAGFVFLGFLPPSGAVRRQQIVAVASQPGTADRVVVLFESGNRLARLLRDLDAACAAHSEAPTSGRRRAVRGFTGVLAAPTEAAVARPRGVLVCRELTKLHEEQRRFASLADAAAAFADDGAEMRGEFTVLVGPRARASSEV